MSRRKHDPAQPDLFVDTGDAAERLYPTRAPVPEPQAGDFDRRLRQAVATAIRISGKSREDVAGRMAALLGQPGITKHMVDAYCAPARDTHKLSVERFMALVRATGDLGLLDLLAAEVGCTVLDGEEMRLARLGYEVQRRRTSTKSIRTMLAQPPVRPRLRRVA